MNERELLSREDASKTLRRKPGTTRSSRGNSRDFGSESRGFGFQS